MAGRGHPQCSVGNTCLPLAGHRLIGRVARVEPMTLLAVMLAAGLLLAFAALANVVSRGGTRPSTSG